MEARPVVFVQQHGAVARLTINCPERRARLPSTAERE
jgi:hypothetical protein